MKKKKSIGANKTFLQKIFSKFVSIYLTIVQTQLSKEYGISLSAINKWVKRYSEIKTEDGDIFTAQQIKELQKRNARLEEENLILKKAIAIFTPHSSND